MRRSSRFLTFLNLMFLYVCTFYGFIVTDCLEIFERSLCTSSNTFASNCMFFRFISKLINVITMVGFHREISKSRVHSWKIHALILLRVTLLVSNLPCVYICTYTPNHDDYIDQIWNKSRNIHIHTHTHTHTLRWLYYYYYYYYYEYNHRSWVSLQCQRIVIARITRSEKVSVTARTLS